MDRALLGSVLALGIVMITPLERAAASITYVSQDRSVSVFALLPPDSANEHVAADDFGPFVESLSVIGATEAEQDSFLGADRIEAFLSATAFFDSTTANSDFAVQFEIDRALAFELTGVVTSFARFALGEVGGPTIVDVQGGAVDASEPLAASGSLLPGLYEVFAEAEGPGGTETVDFVLTVPEPAILWLMALGLVALGTRTGRGVPGR